MAETATENYIPNYQFVDDIPELFEARNLERNRAEEILEDRRYRQSIGLEPVLEPVDPLSTAYHVNNASSVEERAELFEGLRLDCQRLVAEWYRKKKPEYFPPSRHRFDNDSEEFYSNGLSIRQMTENALIPISEDPEEEARRINEQVEEVTPQLVRSLGGLAMVKTVRTISQCTDTAIHSYEYDQKHQLPHRGYRGYVPEIKKLMIRDTTLDGESNDRTQEQIGLPGIYITHEIIQMTLERRGLDAANKTKTELHGSQLLVEDDLMSFAYQLDEVASEQWCTNIFMGEEVPDDYVKDYDNFRGEALERQEKLVDIADEVAGFVLVLEEDQTSRGEALQLVEDFIKIKLGDLGKRDIEAAEQMFDAKTATQLQRVAKLEQQGRFEEADILFNETMREAPGGGGCGGGSCGLESVNLETAKGQYLKSKLNAKEGDTITEDKVRSCKGCGEKKLSYAHNAGKVNTWCDGCKTLVTKKTAAPTKVSYTLAA